MRIKLISALVLFSFLPYSISSTPVGQEQSQESMKSYITSLEKQLELSNKTIESLEIVLMNLENYKNNIDSYNLSTTKLTEKEKMTLEEEKLLNKQLATSIQEWETKYQKVMTLLTSTEEASKKLQDQLDQAKKDYDLLYGDFESHKKKTSFWDTIQNILIGVALVLGFVGGLQI